MTANGVTEVYFGSGLYLTGPQTTPAQCHNNNNDYILDLPSRLTVLGTKAAPASLL